MSSAKVKTFLFYTLVFLLSAISAIRPVFWILELALVPDCGPSSPGGSWCGVTETFWAAILSLVGSLMIASVAVVAVVSRRKRRLREGADSDRPDLDLSQLI